MIVLIRIILGIGFGACIGVILVGFIHLATTGGLPKSSKAVRIGPYQQYQTADSIADRWHDVKLVGACSTCGMNDSPLVRTYAGKSDYKWCAELSNLTYHLTYKTVGR